MRLLTFKREMHWKLKVSSKAILVWRVFIGLAWPVTRCRLRQIQYNKKDPGCGTGCESHLCHLPQRGWVSLKIPLPTFDLKTIPRSSSNELLDERKLCKILPKDEWALWFGTRDGNPVGWRANTTVCWCSRRGSWTYFPQRILTWKGAT